MSRISTESDLSLEVVILLIVGIFMLLFGILLFGIHTGDLPYSPDSMYGLLLVLVSFQIVTMGKTPFGDLRRSWAVIITGICTAVIGMTACFIPGLVTDLVRILVGIMLLIGGAALLFQLFVSEEKAKKWVNTPGIVRRLIVACGLVYSLSLLLGLVTLLPGVVTNPVTAVLLVLYGVSILHLSWCIQQVNRTYPREDGLGESMNLDSSAGRYRIFGDATLPLSLAILLMLGVLLVLLGALLFPVNLGLIPFSPDGQLGLLLVINAIQMMSLGETPLGQYRRSWLIIIIGVGFASVGIFSCIIPGILTDLIRIFLGILNIAGGALLLAKQSLPMLHALRNPSAEQGTVPPVIRKMQKTQTILYIVSIAFGITMLLPGIVSGLIIAGIIIINGLLLFRLGSILAKIL